RQARLLGDSVVLLQRVDWVAVDVVGIDHLEDRAPHGGVPGRGGLVDLPVRVDCLVDDEQDVVELWIDLLGWLEWLGRDGRLLGGSRWRRWRGRDRYRSRRRQREPLLGRRVAGPVKEFN